MRHYKLAPLNIASGLVVIFSVYSAINPGPEGWGILALIYFLPLGLLGLFIDFVIQKFLKKYIWTFTIELCLLFFLCLCYSWRQRAKIFIVSNQWTHSYVATIYGVKYAPPLPKKLLSWKYEIRVPENGIILTSSDISSDLPETKMKTTTGVELNTKSAKLGFGRITTDTFYCDNKIYHYQVWMVDTSCCMYSTNNLDSLKNNLRTQFYKR